MTMLLKRTPKTHLLRISESATSQRGHRCVLLIILSAVLLSSCTRARINQFKNFSQAGSVYSNAITTLLDEAGTAAIDTDSMVLAKTRSSLGTDERKQAILEHNKLLRDRVAILGDLKRHARLLRSYFDALGMLAESDAPTAIGGAAEGVVDALGKLHPKIANATIGSSSVSTFVGGVTTIIVGQLRMGAMEKELKARASTIERELDLQQAALSAVAEELRTDLLAQIQQVESNEVVLPYVADGALPGEWAKRRKTTLSTTFALASAEAAADAAKKLKVAFAALCEGRFQLVDLQALVADINEILNLIEKAKGKE